MNGALVRCGRWAEAMSLLSRPDNFPSYLECELRLMDSIWHAAGDTSADLNWYTKRVSLATIYKVGQKKTLDGWLGGGKDGFRENVVVGLFGQVLTRTYGCWGGSRFPYLN